MPAAPLEENSPWVSKDGSIEIPYEEVCDNMSEIGTELAMLQMSKLLYSCILALKSLNLYSQYQILYSLLILNQIDGSVEDYKEFLEKYSSVLHRNHYHMLTAKHSLMQMYGRTEGYLIQDMTDDQVTKSIIFNVERVHSSII